MSSDDDWAAREGLRFKRGDWVQFAGGGGVPAGPARITGFKVAGPFPYRIITESGIREICAEEELS